MSLINGGLVNSPASDPDAVVSPLTANLDLGGYDITGDGIDLNNTDTGQEILFQENGTTFLRFYDSAFDGFIQAPLNDDLNLKPGTTGDKTFIWSGAGSRMMTIADAGVGIGEESPDYKLDVNGSFGFTPGTSVAPVDNGDVTIAFTNNTTLTFSGKGTDGTTRTATLTLA